MSNDFNNKATIIFNFLNINNSLIMIFSIVAIVVYFYLRNKIKIIYLLDIIMVTGFILTIYIMDLPHRYHAISHFILLAFRDLLLWRFD